MTDVAELERTWARRPGLTGWLMTTNHKDIGHRYIVTAMIFFALGGVLALLMRLQLARPGNHLVGPDGYNQLFTVHGTTMMFLFAVPVMEAVALMIIPLMLGTRNVAFPRLNAFGYWVYLVSGILLWGGLLLNMGPDAGWFAYPPLSGPMFGSGHRVDLWADMITLSEISSLVGAVEIIATVFKLRAPGMSLSRIPVYVWAMVVTSFMILFAMPGVMTASGLLAMDRLADVNTHFFNFGEGGDVLLYQHLFWFFGHPEVYIIFLPATGMVSLLLETYTRRRVFGYHALLLSLIGTAFVSFGLWVHHMFATTVPELGRSFFTAASMMIAIPSGTNIFCWLATLWTGRPVFRAPLYYVLGFIALFVMGGLTGIMLASVPVDLQVHDSFFVVAHFHYVLIGGSVFPLLGALIHWFPKMTGRMMHEGLAKLNFWILFVGFNITFFPMHILGLHGMPRRIYTYLPQTGWGGLNLVSSIGAGILGIGVLLFVLNALVSLRRGAIAGPNPWGAGTLEWATTSPPPRYNWVEPPTCRGREPLWLEADPSIRVTGLATGHREVLATTILEAAPEHRYAMPPDSIWPLLLAIVSGLLIVGLLFHPWAVPIGALLAFGVLLGWFNEGVASPGVPEDASTERA